MNVFGNQMPEVVMRGSWMAIMAGLVVPGVLMAQARVVSAATLDSGVPIRFRIDGKERRGTLVSVDPDSLVIMRQGVFERYDPQQADGLAYGAGQHRNVLLGMGLGLAGGLVLVLYTVAANEMIWQGNGNPENTSATRFAKIIGVSVGIGALAGLAFPSERWVAVQVPRTEALRIAPYAAGAPAGGGVVGLRVTW